MTNLARHQRGSGAGCLLWVVWFAIVMLGGVIGIILCLALTPHDPYGPLIIPDVLIFCVSGGTLLGLVALPLVRRAHAEQLPMSTVSPTLWETQSLLIAVAVFIGGYLAGIWSAELRLRAWHSLGAPPVAQVSLLGSTTHDIYVRGENGRTYRCCGYSGEWVENAQGFPGRSQSPFTLVDAMQSPFDAPNPPGQVVAETGSWGQADRGYRQYHNAVYVLLEDGTIWEWRRSTIANNTAIHMHSMMRLWFTVATILLAMTCYVLIQRRWHHIRI